MRLTTLARAAIAALAVTIFPVAHGSSRAFPQAPYDLAIVNGRVMDPETGLDATRTVAIRGGRIEAIVDGEVAAGATLDARGLVVAPGFIDLHSHAQSAEAYRLKAFDGVTTALEMEIGVPDIGAFVRAREGRALINFGATAGYVAARVAALGAPIPAGTLLPASGPATEKTATEAQINEVKATLARGLDDGALGIGVGLAYTPGASRLEVIEVYRLAAARQVPIYTHVRSNGRIEPGSAIEAVGEAIGAAAISGAAVHIVHINSTGARDAAECLRMVEGARARGLDVTTEAYPYGAGMTAVNSAIFNPGWTERTGLDYKDLQVVETGERLTKGRFEELHARAEPQMVLIFTNPDTIVDAVMTHPLVMVASDGLIENGKGHPRASGTYARVLARYVRMQRRLTLMDGLRKMTLMPAQRLERAAAGAGRKGRLQPGADADIVVFDPETIADRATYEAPAQPSVGVTHLLVNGTPVIRGGVLVAGAAPGKALLRDR